MPTIKSLIFFSISLFSIYLSSAFAEGTVQPSTETFNEDSFLILPEGSGEFEFRFNKESSPYYLKRWQITDKDMIPPPKVFEPSEDDLDNLRDNEIFKMQEYNTNYIIFGEPDTKVQFSFKFKFFKNIDIFLGYTQVMFWKLFQEDSSPFTEINYNPEFFYKYQNKTYLFNEIDIGYSHLSNGKDEVGSRSVDSVYLNLMSYEVFDYGIPTVHLKFRYLFNKDKTNKDIRDFYGPLNVIFYFNRLGRKIFQSEELYFEYYNGGKLADDFSKTSVRLSLRYKFWKSSAAPKIFIQYFNGYGENLANYNIREETCRIGFSIGGF